MAEDYAPFKINVTTVQPGSFANGAALRVAIGDDLRAPAQPARQCARLDELLATAVLLTVTAMPAVDLAPSDVYVVSDDEEAKRLFFTLVDGSPFRYVDAWRLANARIVDTVWKIARGEVKSSRETLDRVDGRKRRRAVVVQADYLSGLIDDTILVKITGSRFGIPGTEVPIDPAVESA